MWSGLEPFDAEQNAMERHRSEERGKGWDGRHLATLSYDAESEKRARDLPVFVGDKKPMQKSDGSFPFMLGYDVLGDAPLG